MELIPQFFAILFVLALLAAAIWLLRRKSLLQFNLPGRGQSPRQINAVERLSLTPQHSVHLLRIGERGVLLSTHPAGCTLLESRPWQEFES
jgi:flagellar biogenesis protein FliO